MSATVTTVTEVSTEWDLSRPHETLRAVCIRYLDGRLPSVRFVVIDDTADPGGSELLYREIAVASTAGGEQ